MPTSYVIMGVSGCGKSTVGKLLGTSLGIPFYDGDDFHPEANVAKMRSGVPLNDEDRQPWLEILLKLLKESAPCVIACSALKKKYRDILRACSPTFVHLNGSRELLLERIRERASSTEHFMPASLLDTQLADLELPTDEPDIITIEISDTPEHIIASITGKKVNSTTQTQ